MLMRDCGSNFEELRIEYLCSISHCYIRLLIFAWVWSYAYLPARDALLA